MQAAMRTTDQLKQFWNERALIEEQYAARLATLAKFAVGGDEIGELRNSLDGLLLETEKQAALHAGLASSIRSLGETATSNMYTKQVTHKRVRQHRVENLFQVKQAHEKKVAKAQKKTAEDNLEVQSGIQQCADVQATELELAEPDSTQAAIARADEVTLSSSTEGLIPIESIWEVSWKEFCDSCQDLEESRMECMKDVLWAYANEISTVCVNDDLSCERIRVALEKLEPEREVQSFVIKHGTGSLIVTPTTIASATGHDGTVEPVPIPARLITRSATFKRSSTRDTTSSSLSDNSTPPPSYSGPETPQSLVELLNKEKDSTVNQSAPTVKFCVKALYDYTATIDEEFDFQEGDIIAVTATPDDGWWSGELLDETRKREGKHLFPSNFVVPLDATFQVPSRNNVNESGWGCLWPLRFFSRSS
ncbi:hypothetical protein H0H92_009652 [Tricholoma furcatifolium]|nr:hypothetical protein H0H92_009652 [Tricholoma furcatifolium]